MRISACIRWTCRNLKRERVRSRLTLISKTHTCWRSKTERGNSRSRLRATLTWKSGAVPFRRRSNRCDAIRRSSTTTKRLSRWKSRSPIATCGRSKISHVRAPWLRVSSSPAYLTQSTMSLLPSCFLTSPSTWTSLSKKISKSAPNLWPPRSSNSLPTYSLKHRKSVTGKSLVIERAKLRWMRINVTRFCRCKRRLLS